VAAGKQLSVLIASTILLAACSGSAASESESGDAGATPSIAAAQDAGPTEPAPKDPALVPSIEEAALDPCPPGVSNPDVAIPGLPAVTYRCLGYGPDVNLSTLRGTPLVVNVWASWCPPCIAEMPILTSAAADLRGEVQFLGIDIQDQDASALEMMAAFGADFPSVVDEAGEIRGLLAIPGPPVTFFVNEQGVIVGRHDGALPSTEYFNALLDEYLGVSR
jgi:cytochrome c biogenesis protein CcmG, thiol:disulfide interchange protein DsbE